MMGVLIASYIDELGISNARAGAILTAGLAGTAALTFLIGRYAERLGRRRVLVLGGVLAIGTGFAYAGAGGFWPLLVVAFLGSANTTSGDVSAFLPVEQAVLSQVSEGPERVRTFAWFNVAGSLAAAFGAAAAGLSDALSPALGDRGAIRALFLVYGALGLASAFAAAFLPGSVELGVAERRTGLGPSRRRVASLSGLFALDSFAGGMIVSSVIALFFLREFGFTAAETGAVFFGATLLQTMSFLVSAKLSTRFGLVRTMVFTHLPSNLLLAGVAFAPTAGFAIAALYLRAFLSQMDVPPRQALVMSVVEPGERAAAAAYTGLTRSLASTPGPALGGALLGTWAGAPFVACAALKSTYDLALLALFGRVEAEMEGKGVSSAPQGGPR